MNALERFLVDCARDVRLDDERVYASEWALYAVYRWHLWRARRACTIADRTAHLVTASRIRLYRKHAQDNALYAIGWQY